MKNKNYIITIVVLVIINIIALLLLWIGKPKHNLQGTNKGIGEKVRIQEMLKEELDFSEEQAKQFLELRETHREKSVKLDEELKLLKREMFQDAMYSDKTIISDSLLNLSLEKQSQLELLTFQHFLKLKEICTPEQQTRLFEIVHRLLGKAQQGGPPRGERPAGPPPGEFREGHPPPRNIN